MSNTAKIMNKTRAKFHDEQKKVGVKRGLGLIPGFEIVYKITEVIAMTRSSEFTHLFSAQGQNTIKVLN
jgi:hypothetical protein